MSIQGLALPCFFHRVVARDVEDHSSGHLTVNPFPVATGRSVSYTYDGYGHRVQKVAGSTTTVYIFSGGKVLDEYDNGAAIGSPTREYIYSGGKMIAKISGGATTYYHSDHLSTRLITNSTGAVVEQLGHFPLGESWYDTGSELRKFTSYSRDTESLNDYAMARYHVNRLGRFSSPDPLSGTVADPQSLNHYSYVGNDPINNVDPSGADMQQLATEDGGDSWILTGGTICSFAGINADCSWANSPGFQGCPNNACSGINGNGQLVYYEAVEMGSKGSGGAYYSVFYGPGAMFTSFLTAGTAAIDNINQQSISQNIEYSGQIYVDANGMFSYTPPVTLGLEAGSAIDPNAIPYGTQFAGDYHTHGASSVNSDPQYLDEVFSDQDIHNADVRQVLHFNSYRGSFLGTPLGRIEYYNPYPGIETVYFLRGVIDDMTLFPWTYPRWP